MADPAKCPHCKGWAFEPGVFPMAPCTVCGVTGRKPGTPAPAAADPGDLAEERG